MDSDNNNIPKLIPNSPVALDDERRVKVLSPSMLVFKRFIRNKLAITGILFIVLVFIFSFVGGWVMPYNESQVFTTYTDMSKDYAGVTVNTEYRFTQVEGAELPAAARSQFVLAVNNSQASFSVGGNDYAIEKINDRSCLIYGLKEVAMATTIAKKTTVSLSEDLGDPGFETAFREALKNGAESFESKGKTYVVNKGKKNSTASLSMPLAMSTLDMFDFASADANPGFDFRYNAELAIAELQSQGGNRKTFEAGGKSYELILEDGQATVYSNKQMYANISEYTVQSVYNDIFLTLDFKSAAKEMIAQDQTSFTFNDKDGNAQEYTIERTNKLWTIKWVESSNVIMSYASPTWEHPLGTDSNGMDMLTRLMYGGRVSLLIGFIVVFIELIIGVILGGISGYFGKFIDNLLMRIVDIFNCIPSFPLIIIIGAVMDAMRVDPTLRMVYLMLILGVLYWPAVARLVRGQILSLREQEFMVATEATGLSVNRRIFRHLVPNVIPQLIVYSTLDLGNIIIIESTLSFLGLGVKFPFASWGNIINAVSNVHVMTNYLFVWIPAGLCIIITVLGFNFIGDGLRDAFDPKMKR